MITLPLPYPIVNRFSQNTCEDSVKKKGVFLSFLFRYNKKKTFSHSYLCRRRHKVARIAEPNWTFASRFLRRKAPAEWRIYEKSSRTGKDSSPIRLFLFLCTMYVLTLQRPLRLWQRLFSIAVSAQTLRFRSFRLLYR